MAQEEDLESQVRGPRDAAPCARPSDQGGLVEVMQRLEDEELEELLKEDEEHEEDSKLTRGEAPKQASGIG